MDEKNNDYNRIISIGKKRGEADLELLIRTNELALRVYQTNSPSDASSLITHAWAVARLIGDMELESSLISAALLHDVLKHGAKPDDLRDFPETTSKTVTSLAALISPIPQRNTAGEDCNIQASAVLEDYNVLYIKIADLIHSLKTLSGSSDKAKNQLLEEVGQFYLPFIKHRRLVYLYDLLRDAYFQAESASRYRKIHGTYHKLLNVNKYTSKNTRNLIQKTLLNNESLSEHPAGRQNEIWGCVIRQRLTLSIDDQIRQETVLSEENYLEFITKHKIPLYDISLIINDACQDSPLNVYLMFHKDVFTKEHIFISDIVTDEHKKIQFLLLQDRHQNLYRLFLYRKKEYENYMYGDNPKKSTYTASTSRAHNENSILVYTRDSQRIKLEKGATVLDFAFRIHKQIGLCAKYGIVNQNLVSLDTILKENDRIEIITADEGEKQTIRAKLNWLNFVQTRKAKDFLIQWFEENYTPKPKD